MSHVINHMSFGEKYPGIVNPLDGVVQIADNSKSCFLLNNLIHYLVWRKMLGELLARLDGVVQIADNSKFSLFNILICHMSSGEKYPGIINTLDDVIQIADNSKSCFLLNNLINYLVWRKISMNC